MQFMYVQAMFNETQSAVIRLTKLEFRSVVSFRIPSQKQDGRPDH